MTELSKIFSVAQELALETGQFLLSRFGSDFKVSKKGRINLVTEVDLKAEEMIVGRIRQEFPHHEILAEEKGSYTCESSYKWIVDPIDGTTNYAHGYRFFCVSIAVEYKGQIVLGVIYDPITEELFSARRGRGAFLNSRKIFVSGRDLLTDSLLCTGFSYDVEEIKENLELFNRIILHARAVRRDGSAALDLCYVACGRFDGFWELSLQPWDVAAGTLIVSEAGGLLTNFNGTDCTIYGQQILATNGRIHRDLIQLLTA